MVLRGHSENDLVEAASAVLRSAPAGLFTDVDGTISPIVSAPGDARVLPLARRALERLSRHLALVGVVSGRPVADARQMVGVEGAVYVGNHGLELWTAEGPTVLPQAAPWVPRIAEALAALRVRLRLERLTFENKGASATIHYRLAADQMRAERAILDALADLPEARGLRIEPGRMVVNILPPLDLHKGTAVTLLARRESLRGVVYLGDDVTDTHAFQALADLRARDGVRTLAIGVVGAETPSAVREMADAQVPTVESVAHLLDGVARTLDGEK